VSKIEAMGYPAAKVMGAENLIGDIVTQHTVLAATARSNAL